MKCNTVKTIILISFISIFDGCAFYNPFVPPAITQSTGGEIYTEDSTTQQISSDNMYKATMRSYNVNGKTYHPTVVKIGDKFVGTASWYGTGFHGKQTSNGEYYDMYAHTAAHKTLPMNTLVRVTNLSNGLNTVVRINDRGPFVENRIIDLSYQAAQDIDMINTGTAEVELEVIDFDNNANKYASKHEPKRKKKKSVWKQFDPTKDHTYKASIPTNKTKVITGGSYALQVASFRDKAKADAFQKSCYNSHGRYKSYIKKKVIGYQTVYKVMIDGFKSIDEANDFKNESNYLGAFIIRKQ